MSAAVVRRVPRDRESVPAPPASGVVRVARARRPVEDGWDPVRLHGEVQGEFRRFGVVDFGDPLTEATERHDGTKSRDDGGGCGSV